MSFRGGRGGRSGGGGFRRAGPNDARVSSEVQIFVEGLPKDVKVPELCQYFSTVGRIKNDRLTKKPRVWIYHDKARSSPAFLAFPSTQNDASSICTTYPLFISNLKVKHAQTLAMSRPNQYSIQT